MCCWHESPFDELTTSQGSWGGGPCKEPLGKGAGTSYPLLFAAAAPAKPSPLGQMRAQKNTLFSMINA
jgi:hypothetical protein